MSRIRSLKVIHGVVLATVSSLAVAACGGGGSTKADTSTAVKQPATSADASAAADNSQLSVRTGVHVTNRPTKAFRVKPVNAIESVAIGPKGYPVYTFQGESTHHIICQKTANAKTNCWAFWPPVSVSSSNGISKQSEIGGNLGTYSNHGVLQLTLNGQPLYYFTPDLASKNTTRATGDQLKTFGSVWHIVAAH
jgi:predicted lipoprotein with Yx(FWY)xxD motif